MNKIKYIFAASVIAAQAACGALVVSNVAPTNVLTTSAWFNGEVIDGTNPTLTLYYGTIDRTTNASSWTFSSNYGAAVVGNITLQITNLVAANKYYFRWYATEAGSNVWSVDGTDNFWTKPTSPTSTPAVVSISVQTDEDADLLSPTNFFGKNASKMHDALSVYGYLTNEALWTAASGSVVYVTDSTYTDTVAKAAAAVTTNDTRQLDLTGADVRVADGTESNQASSYGQVQALRTSLENFVASVLSEELFVSRDAHPDIAGAFTLSTVLPTPYSILTTNTQSTTNILAYFWETNKTDMIRYGGYEGVMYARRISGNASCQANACLVYTDDDGVTTNLIATSSLTRSIDGIDNYAFYGYNPADIYSATTNLQRGICVQFITGSASPGGTPVVIQTYGGTNQSSFLRTPGAGTAGLGTRGATKIAAGATDSYDAITRTLTWNTNAAGGGSGSGSGFPLTNNGDLAGFSLTNGGLVQAVSGEFDYVDIGIQLRMTNSESAGALEVVDLMVDADIDDLYYARRNGAWADIDLLGLRGATNALNTRVGLLETSTNALNTRMGAVETATGALNTAVGNLNNSTNALNAKVVALNNSTNALNTRVGKLEGSTNAMNTRLGSLEASTNAINTVANDALPKTFTNTGVMAAMQITGGSPAEGAVLVATNAAGQVGWSSFIDFRAVRITDFEYKNAVVGTIVFDQEVHDYGTCFDGTYFTAPVNGMYSFTANFNSQHGSGSSGYNRFAIEANHTNLAGVYVLPLPDYNSFASVSSGEIYLTNGATVWTTARTGGSAKTNYINSSIFQSSFSGRLIRILP